MEHVISRRFSARRACMRTSLLAVLSRVLVLACVVAFCSARVWALKDRSRGEFEELVRALEDARTEHDALMERARSQIPNFANCQDRLAEATEWFNGAEEAYCRFSVAVYGPDLALKTERMHAVNEARALAVDKWISDAQEDEEVHDVVAQYCSGAVAPRRYSGIPGVNVGDAEGSSEAVMAALRGRRDAIGKQVTSFLDKHEFVTPAAWAYIQEEAVWGFKRRAAATALLALTPQDLKDAQRRVRDIERQLSAEYPDLWRNHLRHLSELEQLRHEAKRVLAEFVEDRSGDLLLDLEGTSTETASLLTGRDARQNASAGEAKTEGSPSAQERATGESESRGREETRSPWLWIVGAVGVIVVGAVTFPVVRQVARRIRRANSAVGGR